MGAERTEGDGGGPVDAAECPERESHCADVDDVQLRFRSDRPDKVQVVLGRFPLEADGMTKLAHFTSPLLNPFSSRLNFVFRSRKDLSSSLTFFTSFYKQFSSEFPPYQLQSRGR
jgi:hypothetical protein